MIRTLCTCAETRKRSRSPELQLSVRAIPHSTGLAWQKHLACDLAARGLVIFSGLARGGVDAAAHHGAITAKGKTVAVFGTGVDVIYPKENRRLVDQLLALGGAIISEFPLNTFAAPKNSPIRNRIIGGISLACLW